MNNIKFIITNWINKLNSKSFFYIALFILFLLYLVFRIIIIGSYSPDIVVGEDNNIWNIQKMLQGKPLYTNPEDYPFEIFQYTPISQYLTFCTAKLLNFKVGNFVHEIFMIGRFYSLLFNILSSIVIFKINKVFFKISDSINLTLSYFSLILITYIDYTLRADSLSNLLVLLSIFWFLKTFCDDKVKYIFYTVLFSLLAIFTKQTAIQLLVYFSVIYMLYRAKKLIIYSTFGIAITITFCLFFYLMYGKLFFYSTIIGISNPAQLSLGISLFFDYCQRYGILLILSLFSIFIKQKNDTLINTYVKILFFLFIGSFVFSFGISQKIGAGINYYSLNFFISIILSSIVINNFHKNESINYKYLTLIFIASLTTFYSLFDRLYNRHLPQISAKNKTEYNIDVQFVKDIKKKIGIAKNQDYIFTPNKNIKNLYFHNTVLPNTEYYSPSASKFDWSKFDKKKLKYIIINENDSYVINKRTFDQFNINLSDYSLLYKSNNRKLYILKNND